MRRDSFVVALVLILLAIISTVSPIYAVKSLETTSSTSLIVKNSIDAVVLIVVRDAKGSVVGQGSGFFVSSDGYLVTNHHVISNAVSAMAKLKSGTYYDIEGVALLDCDADLAVLKVTAIGVQFPNLPLGNSLRVEVGERVMAIGSPYALEASISEGIISGIRQSDRTKISFFQTTTPVSPGSSGGPLLNSKGEVIGIVNASLPQAQNINFAVPSERLKALLSGRTEAPNKGMVSSCPPPDSPSENPGVSSISGTYTGIWQSSLYPSSGAAALKVLASGDSIRGWFSVTGSPVGYQGDELLGELVDFGNGVWTVNFKGLNSPLSAKAIFKEGRLIGDYRFLFKRSKVDQGQWILKK
jgi:S1-C subfamily serine protease